ncbi:FACT complex subunit SSRP1-like [Trifolium medium]|uniref:FACT complex subunit SSRP1-like n=1 Tax=Trifolium medium TaxID=97028 RepID=A0A392PK59_9FABA|nr:FACT complex subunit SSRP1-like [Trifolium medium]
MWEEYLERNGKICQVWLVAIISFHAIPSSAIAEEKEPYEAKAQADKKRYKDELSGYKNPQPMNIDSGNESDSA